MDPIQYILAELKEHRKESSDRFTEMNNKLESIVVQTTKTNGRVSRVEKDMVEAFDDIDTLKSIGNVSKGSNKIIGAIWKAAGAIALILIAALIGYFSGK
ncbi:MAG: hypothetical protein KA954_01315 [Chitinophagales bacterium]|nr:hypothetical protein [Chitinophagales bacterium]MBP9845827.1 hypothetical protein [Saprospiraceae bacterium]